MRKTIWIAGVFVVLGIIAAVLYFSFFQGKGGSTPEGTFVRQFDAGDGFAGGSCFAGGMAGWQRSA